MKEELLKYTLKCLNLDGFLSHIPRGNKRITKQYKAARYYLVVYKSKANSSYHLQLFRVSTLCILFQSLKIVVVIMEQEGIPATPMGREAWTGGRLMGSRSPGEAQPPLVKERS